MEKLEFLDEIESRIISYLIDSHPLDEKILYHYTSGDGVLGIIKNKELWATNIKYMNDSSEIKYGCNVIKHVLSKRTNNTLDNFEKEILDYFLEDENRINASLNYDIEIYICCFCENGDLLSQWRGYGSNGAGYSIGFDPHYMNLTTDRGITFFKVLYELNQQEEAINKVLDIFFSSLNELKVNKHDFKKEILNHLTLEFLDLVCIIKHPSFAEEKEWRILKVENRYIPDDSLSFRTINGRLIPYIKITFARNKNLDYNYLTTPTIYFGPTLHPELTEKSLYMLINKYDLGFTEIQRSSIPFNNVKLAQ